MPVLRALASGRVPYAGKVLHMGEEGFEKPHAMAKADNVRVQDHAEIAPAAVLGVKLECAVGQEGLGIFQP
jgi:hypothetical protein